MEDLARQARDAEELADVKVRSQPVDVCCVLRVCSVRCAACCRMLPAACCLLPAACCLLCSLLSASGSLLAARCSLRSMAHAACSVCAYVVTTRRMRRRS